ncbi:MAG TPA: archease [candidate division Zixibacteria bacterium]|nr:archease [candidate division Zixibacteria bacterium]
MAEVQEPDRGHVATQHTADVGLRAWASDRRTLFEEAAAGLAAISADVDPEAAREAVPVETDGDDLEQLAFTWLNELIGLAEDRRQALCRAEVAELDQDEAWRLRARAWFAPYDGSRVRPRLQVKAATMHGLQVEELPDRWELEAYLDV